MKFSLLAFSCLCLGHLGWSQTTTSGPPKQYWLDGFSRTWFTSDALLGNEVNPASISSGWNLLDLNPHVNPVQGVEVFAQIRVLNEFGGFFGQGTQVDVRQLRVSGVLKNKVKFNLGDVYLNQSEFTLHADEGEVSDPWGHAFAAQRDLVAYENFFQGNRWRLQGAQANASFKGDRWIEHVVLDGYVTRPRGSRQLSESTYSPDRVLAGLTTALVGQEGWSGELHHAVLADLPYSGTLEHNVLNPVTHGLLHKQPQMNGARMLFTAEGGWSNHSWRIRDMMNGEVTDLSDSRKGGFAGLQFLVAPQDSSWQGGVAYREVDPFFRSAGAQSKRYNFSDLSIPSVFPVVGEEGLSRSVSLFDLISDVTVANQGISATLMPIAPLFDNVLPYGQATPNRRGAMAHIRRNFENAKVVLRMSRFAELTGQGTSELRRFSAAGLGVEWNAAPSASRNFRVSAYEQVQHTLRGGSDLERVELLTSNLTLSAALELLPQFWIECSGRHAMGAGHEYLNVRSELGELFNFQKTELDVQAWMTSLGIMHSLSKDVSARAQWNVWGQNDANRSSSKILASQMFIVISADL